MQAGASYTTQGEEDGYSSYASFLVLIKDTCSTTVTAGCFSRSPSASSSRSKEEEVANKTAPVEVPSPSTCIVVQVRIELGEMLFNNIVRCVRKEIFM